MTFRLHRPEHGQRHEGARPAEDWTQSLRFPAGQSGRPKPPPVTQRGPTCVFPGGGYRSYNAEQIELRLGLTIKHKAPRRGSWLGGLKPRRGQPRSTLLKANRSRFLQSSAPLASSRKRKPRRAMVNLRAGVRALGPPSPGIPMGNAA